MVNERHKKGKYADMHASAVYLTVTQLVKGFLISFPFKHAISVTPGLTLGN